MYKPAPRFAHLSEGDIIQRLAQTPNDATPGADVEFPALAELLTGPPHPAAVLAPLLHLAGDWQLLFTRRTATLMQHSGQVSFPGGRADPEDPSPEVTALREAKEEIGLDPAHVRILGRMRDYLTITNYRVTPVVGVIPWPYALQPAGSEVARIFTIPLAWLAAPENHTIRLRPLPEPYPPAPVVYFNPYQGEVLWGATARMTLHLLELLA